jgi:hypothetical protein
MLIDGVIVSTATNFVFPHLLSGWIVFGPIGVAMSAMSWCLVVGYAWVAIACLGTVLWERAAPIRTVVAAQTAP